MRRLLIFMSLALFIGQKIQAQSNNKAFDKMIFLFVDEKYEKCLKMSLGFTQNDNYKREALPYLYASMSFYEIARKDVLIEKYPKAMKDAMKYAYKYRKKDKELKYVGRYTDYFDELKDSCNQMAQHYYKTEDYRKAASTYKGIVRFDPNDKIMQLWWGISEVKAKNVGEGDRNIELAMEQIDENYIPSKVILWNTAAGLEEYASYMESKGDYSGKRKGEQLAEKFKKFDPAEIERLEKLRAEQNKPKKEVKTFSTSEEAAEAAKKNREIIGTQEQGIDEAKKEIENIKKEEGREVKSFESD